MKLFIKLSLFFLLSANLFAQDLVYPGRGGASYNWTADSTNATTILSSLYVQGFNHPTRISGGDNTYTPYIRYWVSWDGVKDSTQGGNVYVDISSLGVDTLYYDHSTLQANGHWSNSPDEYYKVQSFWYLVSSEGDTLISSDGDYLITTIP